MNLLEFIVASHRSESEEQLFNLLKEFLTPYGFDSMIFCLMTDHASIGESAKHGIITGYPEDWMKHYAAQDYEVIDPIRKEVMLESQRIFDWEKVDLIRPYNKKERTILNEAKECGLRNGVAVSLQNNHNEFVALGFARSNVEEELDEITLSMLKLLSIQYYDMYLSLKEKQNQKIKPRIHLSDREIEVLKWSAAGKSNGDIATILNISDRTVNFHLQQCFAKLNANSKTLAVVKAIRLGLITLDSDFKISTKKSAKQLKEEIA